jgi:uncharacterized protein (TIGR02996 family)
MGLKIQDAFLRDICDNPEDDTLRLVFADWLEEHGDPARAEFIRVQCEAARLPDEDPRKVDLLARQQQLLDANREDWVAPFRRLGAAKYAEFERGFVQGVTLDGERLVKHAEKLFRKAPVRRLSLTAADAGHVRALGDMAFLRNLTELSLELEPIGDELAGVLAASAHFGNLRRLTLGGCRLHDEGVRALARAVHLVHLEELDLYANDITDEGVTEIASSDNFRSLKSLHLGSQAVTDAGVEALATSPRMAQLILLALDSTDISDAAVEALGRSRYLRKLRHLWLTNTDLGTCAVRALLRSKNLKDLEFLEITPDFDEELKQALEEHFGDRISFYWP